MYEGDNFTILDRAFEQEKENAEIRYVCKAYVNDEYVGKVESFDSDVLTSDLYKLEDRVDQHIAEIVKDKWEAGEYGEYTRDEDND